MRPSPRNEAQLSPREGDGAAGRRLGEGGAAWLLGPPSLLPAEAERPQALVQRDQSWASPQEAPQQGSVRLTQPEPAPAEDTRTQSC